MKAQTFERCKTFTKVGVTKEKQNTVNFCIIEEYLGRFNKNLLMKFLYIFLNCSL